MLANWNDIFFVMYVFFQTFINLPGWLTQVEIDAVKQAAVTSLSSSPEDSDLDDIHMYTVNT